MWSVQFRWLFAARLVSYLGTSIAPVALVFAILGLDSSPLALGLVLACGTVPMVLLMLPGGVIADRLSRSRVLVIAHLVSGCAQAMAAGMLLTGHASITGLCVVQAVNGTAVGFALPALNSVVPMVVADAHFQRANALLSTTRNLAAVLGPAVAAGVVVAAVPGWGLAVDAVCYLVAAGCAARLRLPTAWTGDPEPRATLLGELRAGWSAFRTRRWVWAVVAAFTVVNMVQSGVIGVLGPVIAQRTFGTVGWGLAMSAEAVGFLASSALLLVVGLRRPLLTGMLAMLATLPAVLMLGLSLPRALPFVIASALSGFAMEIFGVGWSTALHHRIPPHLLSRVSSYDALGSFAAVPVGQLLAGPVSGWVGAQATVIGGATLSLVAILAAVAVPEVRRLTLRPQDRSPESLQEVLQESPSGPAAPRSAPPAPEPW